MIAGSRDPEVGGILHLEHVNFTVPGQDLITAFFINGLGLTRDPYKRVDETNFGVNVGQQQFHLPSGGETAPFPGCVHLVSPDRDMIVMRLRRLPQDEPREAELSSIEGPIVEATQPGQIQYDDESAPPPADFLFDVVTTPQLSGLGPDEPLFNEVAPLAKPADDADTLNEDAPPMLDMGTLQAAIQTEASRSDHGRPAADDGELFGDVAKSLFAAGHEPATREIPYLKRFGRAAREDRSTLPPPTPGAAATEVAPQVHKLQVVERTRGPRTRVLAAVGGAVLLLWLLGLAWVARDSLSVWMGAPQKTVVPGEQPAHAGRRAP